MRQCLRHGWTRPQLRAQVRVVRSSAAARQVSPRPTEASLAKAAARVDLCCPEVERGCQVCSVQTGLNSPPVLTKARDVFAAYGVDLASTFLTAHGWRTRARVAVRGRAGSQAIRIGLFKPGTHEVFPLLACPLHHARINEALQLLHSQLQAWQVPPYVEVPAIKRSKRKPGGPQSHGLLRYLQLTVCDDAERDGGERLVQAVFVVNCSKGDKQATQAIRAALADLYAARGPASRRPLLHSVWLNFQQAAGNDILGSDFTLLHGSEWAWQRYNRTLVALSPASFVQANTAAMAAALRHICSAVPSAAHVIDLHAGVGTIGLSILDERPIASLTCVEINGSGRDAFELGLQRLSAEKRGTPSVYRVCAAGSVPRAVLAAADVIVVDPPRKGLETSLVEALRALDGMDKPDSAQQSPIEAWAGDDNTSEQEERDAVCVAQGAASDSAKCSVQAASQEEGREGEQKLVYLSCGFVALQRDLAALHKDGPWRVCSAHAFVFFPGSDAIETLVILQRRR